MEDKKFLNNAELKKVNGGTNTSRNICIYCDFCDYAMLTDENEFLSLGGYGVNHQRCNRCNIGHFQWKYAD